MDQSEQISKKLILTVERYIETTRSCFRSARLQDIRDFDHTLNLGMQSGIFVIDMAIPLLNMENSKTKSEQSFYLRMMIIVIKDFLDGISSLIGKDLIRELQQNNFPEFIDELNEINKKYSIIRNKHAEELSFFRNKVSAHKTKDSMSYLWLLESMEIETYRHIGLELANNTLKLTNVVRRITLKIADRLNNMQTNYAP